MTFCPNKRRGGGGGKSCSHAEVKGGGGIKFWCSFNLRALAIIKGCVCVCGGGGVILS